MATFNGRSYLESQVESILNQSGVRIEIDVIDDGSTDGTLKLLEELRLKNKINSLRTSQRLGASKVFQKLLIDAKPADFYAFSDQDDIWESRKLESQIKLINTSSPTLVICSRQYIDSNGEILRKPTERGKIPSFNNAMVENIASGNTQLMNQELRDILITIEYTPKHFDFFIYLIASGCGEVIRHENHLVNYRLHETNAIGLGKKSFSHFKELIKDSRDQCQFALSYFRLIDSEKAAFLHTYMQVFHSRFLIQRIYKSLLSNIRRQSMAQTILWKMVSPFLKKSQNELKSSNS